MAELIGCDYSEIVAQSDEKLLRSMLKRANKLAPEHGFTPIVIVCNEENYEWLSHNCRLGRNIPQYREEQLSSVPDGAALLTQLIVDRRAEGFPESWRISEPFGGRAYTWFSEFYYLDGRVKDVLLAYIPTNCACDVFAWLPFNEYCGAPTATETVAVMRHWNKLYGAVPVVVGCNYIELSARELSYSEAVICAEEQYALAPNIVDKGLGSLSALVDTLMKSTVWSLWWD